MSNKKRLDLLLVEKGFYDSREKAKRSIMAGMVLVDNRPVDKPGTEVPLEAPIKIKGDAIPFVSRGGLKLDKALKVFPISLVDKTVLDIGASTGGFTDCALQNGAQKVHAVDVGYGQLAWSLRQDERVINHERTNIRYLKGEDLGDAIDFVTIDVAFISLRLVLPKAFELSSPLAEVVALIKPQFEAGREKVGKKGVVKDPAVHREIIHKVISEAQELGFIVKGLSFSPVKGPEGNIEYLLYLAKDGPGIEPEVSQVVLEANERLKS